MAPSRPSAAAPTGVSSAVALHVALPACCFRASGPGGGSTLSHSSTRAAACRPRNTCLTNTCRTNPCLTNTCLTNTCLTNHVSRTSASRTARPARRCSSGCPRRSIASHRPGGVILKGSRSSARTGSGTQGRQRWESSLQQLTAAYSSLQQLTAAPTTYTAAYWGPKASDEQMKELATPRRCSCILAIRSRSLLEGSNLTLGALIGVQLRRTAAPYRCTVQLRRSRVSRLAVETYSLTSPPRDCSRVDTRHMPVQMKVRPCHSTAFPLPFHCLSTAIPLPFHCFSTAFPRLSLGLFHCIFTAFHYCSLTAFPWPPTAVSLPFLDLPLPVHCLSLTFHCLITASRCTTGRSARL